MFSGLDAANVLYGRRFLDLYAGSGAVGLEAASRGAEHVTLVESDPRALKVIRENVAALRAGAVVTITAQRVATALAAGPTGGPSGGPYDTVFADPPYGMAEEEITAMLAALAERDWVAPGGLVIVERSKRTPELEWVRPLTAERSRRYGETMLWYGRRS